jgi:hypothetical protein
MPNEGHVANIDERGAARRRTGGVVWFAIAIAAAVAMELLRARDGWYALLLVPFTMAALGYFQARERT